MPRSGEHTCPASKGGYFPHKGCPYCNTYPTWEKTQRIMRSRIVRVSCIGSSPELVSNFVDVRASNLEAHGVIKRLGGALARASSSQPIADYLPALEKLLAESHATTSDAFRKPSANVHDVLEALVNEKKIVLSTAKAGGAAAEDGAEQIPRGDAIEAALRAEAFKRVANAVGALNVSERLGRLDTMAAGFDGACVLIVRALCKPIKSSALTARVITPAILNDLHNYVPEYLSWVLTADPHTGFIPRHCQAYSIVGRCDADGRPTGEGQKFLRKLLNFDLATMDWVFSPGGLLAFKRVVDSGSSFPDPSTAGAVDSSLHPLDIFTVFV